MRNVAFAFAILAAFVVSGCANDPTAAQDVAACVATAAPVVVADATGSGSNAQKGVEAGVAVANDPACVNAAANAATAASK